jgi:hypothetical protein
MNGWRYNEESEPLLQEAGETVAEKITAIEGLINSIESVGYYYTSRGCRVNDYYEAIRGIPDSLDILHGPGKHTIRSFEEHLIKELRAEIDKLSKIDQATNKDNPGIDVELEEDFYGTTLEDRYIRFLARIKSYKATIVYHSILTLDQDSLLFDRNGRPSAFGNKVRDLFDDALCEPGLNGMEYADRMVHVQQLYKDILVDQLEKQIRAFQQSKQIANKDNPGIDVELEESSMEDPSIEQMQQMRQNWHTMFYKSPKFIKLEYYVEECLQYFWFEYPQFSEHTQEQVLDFIQQVLERFEMDCKQTPSYRGLNDDPIKAPTRRNLRDLIFSGVYDEGGDAHQHAQENPDEDDVDVALVMFCNWLKPIIGHTGLGLPSSEQADHIIRSLDQRIKAKQAVNQDNPGIDMELEENADHSMIDKYKQMLKYAQQHNEDNLYWKCLNLLGQPEASRFDRYYTTEYMKVKDIEKGPDVAMNLFIQCIHHKIKSLVNLAKDNPGIDIDL